MTYASVCSGVEATSIAWEPLGWRPAWFSEIEKFPCAVLAHRYPSVPNLGDMTKIKGDEHGAIDILVGGTPCQDLSVAGKRLGFGGERSVLALDFVRLAYECGAKWFVWENVPGVFSSAGGQDFAQLLSLFAGWQVDVPSDGWGSFGIVEQSPGCFGLAWRVLDVQYARVDGFPRAIPQRRRRVFVVGHSGGWQRAAQVLFEPKSLLGDTPPRREAGQGVYGGAGGCVAGAGRPWDGSGVNPSLCRGGLGGIGASNQELFCQNFNGLVMQSVSHTLLAKGNLSFQGGKDTLVLDARGNGDGVTCPTVTGDHAGRPTDYTPVVLASGQANAEVLQDGSAASLTCLHEAQIVAIRGGLGPEWIRVVFADECEGYPEEGCICPVCGIDYSECDCPGPTQDDIYEYAECGDVLYARPKASGGDTTKKSCSTVRRLTPIECERLMGFPDNWTRIPWRGKPAEECPDGPRYKACGNSMGVNVMRWIGRRIQEVEDNQ